MTVTTIIAKNQTSEDIYLKNLGVEVPESGQIILTDYLHLYEIRSDKQLFNEVQSDNIIINNGYQDLNRDDSLSMIAPVFGMQFSCWSGDETVSHTTITKTYRNKLLFITPILPAGLYRVGIYYEAKGQSFSRSYLDDFIISACFNQTKKNWMPIYSFAIMELNDGKHRIRIRYRAATNREVLVEKGVRSTAIKVGTKKITPIHVAYIRRARAELWRVG
jgi:hypothetical protein